MSDILKKPVNSVLSKKTPNKEISERRNFTNTSMSIPPLHEQPLPMPKGPVKGYKVSSNHELKSLLKKKIDVKSKKSIYALQVVQDSVQFTTADCDSCKTSPCCYRYLTFIHEVEYKTGLYGDNVIELTEDILSQFKRISQLYVYIPELIYIQSSKGKSYILKKRDDGGCIYLDENDKCSIYEHRPTSCRIYTCDTDPTITQRMKDGEEDPTFSLL